MDGEYVIQPRLARDLNESVPLYLEPQTLEVSLDGERLQLFTLPGVGAGTSARTRRRRVRPRRRLRRSRRRASQAGTPAARGPGRARRSPRSTPASASAAAEREQRNHVDDAWNVRVRVKPASATSPSRS